MGHSDLTSPSPSYHSSSLDDISLASLKLLNYLNEAGLEEMAGYALEMAVLLTDSQSGCLAFFNEHSAEMPVLRWFRENRQLQRLSRQFTASLSDSDSLWNEIAQLNQAIIINPSHHTKKGLANRLLSPGFPFSHESLSSFLGVPLVIDHRLVMIVSTVNRGSDYSDGDIAEVERLLQGLWRYHVRLKAEEALSRSEERLRLLTSVTNEGMWDFDLESGHLNISDHLCSMLGFEREVLEPLWRSGLQKYIHPHDYPSLREKVRLMLKGQIDHYTHEMRFLVNGSYFCWLECKTVALKDAAGRIRSLAGSWVDINQRKQQEERIHNLAYFDSLTRMPNRSSIIEQLENRLGSPHSGSGCGALLYWDLDNFKRINDSFGHAIGDRVLIEQAQRLRHFRSPSFMPARLGGDEFALLIDGVIDRSEIASLAERLLDCITRPVMAGQLELPVTASMGIAIYPRDGSTVQELLKNVDLAMYEAKYECPGAYTFYTPALQNARAGRLVMELRLRHSLDTHELSVYYQPLVELESGYISGFEALLRWNSGEYGFVSPACFIPLAEECGFIHSIGDFVLRQACRFALRINDGSEPPRVVSVNVSPRQLARDKFVNRFMHILEEESCPPRFIGIEITESALVEKYEDNAARLESFLSRGLSVSLDDFGTGYSSLTYLLNLPSTAVKIDRSFIENMLTSERGDHLVSSIIHLIHNLGFKAVAEGIENIAQARRLYKHGCRFVQGFLYSQPVPEEAARALLPAISIPIIADD